MLGGTIVAQRGLEPTETGFDDPGSDWRIPYGCAASRHRGRSLGLPAICRRSSGFPMLEPEEEFMLAKRWREHEDREAAHKLVTSHLRLVAKIAMGYRGYGLPIGEVISEGNVGLMQAVKRFEPDKGFRLATYAMWWIRASIQEYILRSWSLVKMGTTAARRSCSSTCARPRARSRRSRRATCAPTRSTTIATRLGVAQAGRDRHEPPPRRRRLAQRAAARGRRGRVAGLAGRRQRRARRRCSPTARRSDARLGALRSALSVLNPRERRIFEARRLADDPTTLEELSTEFGVSRERVRQIEVRAFEKVQAGGQGRRRQGASAEKRGAGGVAGAVRRRHELAPPR